MSADPEWHDESCVCQWCDPVGWTARERESENYRLQKEALEEILGTGPTHQSPERLRMILQWERDAEEAAR